MQDIDDISQNTPDNTTEKGPKRKKFKSPELKKNAASKKMTFDGVILNELERDSNEDSEEEERKDGSHQDEQEARQRTFTFNKDQVLGLPKVKEMCASAEVSPAKGSPQYKEM